MTWCQQHCHSSRADCPAVEILNEPYGDWFWGPNAEDQRNATAFGKLIDATYDAFHAQFGSTAPKIVAPIWVASTENRADATSTWFHESISGTPDVLSHIDGAVVHPYGFCSSSDAGHSGFRQEITGVHAATGPPVWVTEVGWKTPVTPGTDSPGCNGGTPTVKYLQQSHDVYVFVSWAESLGYVAAITLYDYREPSGRSFASCGGSSKPTGRTSRRGPRWRRRCLACPERSASGVSHVEVAIVRG